MNNEIIITNVKTAQYEHVDKNAQSSKKTARPYVFERADISSADIGNKLSVAIYTLMPGNSNFPYHYHCLNEEVFYIVSGSGVLETEKGEVNVSEGDLIVMPVGKNGAHMLTNNSNEPLVYLDIDTESELDAAFYPKSGKIGVFGEGFSKLFKLSESVGYLEGE